MNPLHDIRTLVAVARNLRSIQCDILLSYTIKPVIYGSLAARMIGVPRSYSLITGLGYSFVADGAKARVARTVAVLLYRLSLASNRRVIFQNPDDRDLFLELGVLRDSRLSLVVDGSGVDLEYFGVAPLPPEPGFLFVGRLIRDKGIGEYIQAARLLKAKYPSLTFGVLGGRDENPSAIGGDVIEDASREGIIQYLGETKDVRPYLAKARVFVLPSYREGTPRTVLEAMAMGRPIVTTDVPGCRETVVQDRNGFLVPARDAEELALAMEKFVLDPPAAERMGRESRIIAEGRFDVRRVNRMIIEGMELG